MEASLSYRKTLSQRIKVKIFSFSDIQGIVKGLRREKKNCPPSNKAKVNCRTTVEVVGVSEVADPNRQGGGSRRKVCMGGFLF